MSVAPEKQPLPQWLIWVGSAVIVFHLFALLIVVLAVPSGPWPLPMGGSSPQEPPQFAQEIGELTTRCYLHPLQMSANYHFESNKTEYDTIYFEAQLRDAGGTLIQTLRFPDEKANIWVMNRQILLAQALGGDEPVMPPRGEVISPPGQKPPTVSIWDVSKGGSGPLMLREIPLHRILGDRPVYRPTDWSLQLARSYARYLGRQSGAASVELIRHSRRPIIPPLMYMDEPPPEALEEMVCSFGEYRLEK